MGNFRSALFGLTTIPNSLYYFNDKLDVHSKNFGGNFQSSPAVSTAMRSVRERHAVCTFNGI